VQGSRRQRDAFFEVFSVGLVVGGSIVIPHLRRAVDLLDQLESGERPVATRRKLRRPRLKVDPRSGTPEAVRSAFSAFAGLTCAAFCNAACEYFQRLAAPLHCSQAPHRR
jgi:hypothetical protein